MYRPDAASSHSASRSRFTAEFTLWSNSTIVPSGHSSRLDLFARVTSSPGRSQQHRQDLDATGSARAAAPRPCAAPVRSGSNANSYRTGSPPCSPSDAISPRSYLKAG
jgi:hypothetical protein